MKVLMYGNPADGFRVVGPFDNAAAATTYIEAERDRSDWWIVELDAPDTQCLSCGELTSIKACPTCHEPVCEKCWEKHTGEHGL